MNKLKIEDLMSGFRITTQEEIGTKEKPIISLLIYKDTPQEVRNEYWWALRGISIEVDGENPTIARVQYNISAPKITGFRVAKNLLDEAEADICNDDAHTIWVFINRKDLWNELIEYFGSENAIWKKYLRWGH